MTDKQTEHDGTASDNQRRRRKLSCGCLLPLLVAVGLLVGATAVFGPRFDFFLVPPSPQGYVDATLAKMDAGYFAKGPAWEQAKREARAETAGAKNYADTYPALRKALQAAGGRHSQFFKPGESLESHDDQRPLPEVQRAGRVTTLRVPELVAQDEAFRTRYGQQLADGVKNQAGASCGWIIDLRGNHGGDMWPMLAGTSALLPDGKALSIRTNTGRDTDVTVNGGEVKTADAVKAKVEGGPKISQPVAVLHDGESASAAEAMTVAFRGRPATRSFGEPTYGVSSANTTVQLYDGASMLLTTAVLVDRRGQVFGDAIPADQATTSAGAEAQAIAWLTGQCH